MPNVTIHLDDETHRLAKTLAAQNSTSLSKMFRNYVRSLAGSSETLARRAILERYSRREITASDAMNELDLSCLEDLMAATVEAGFDLPRLDRKSAMRLADQVVTNPKR